MTSETMLIIYTTRTINENSLRAFKVWFISSQQDIWKMRWITLLVSERLGSGCGKRWVGRSVLWKLTIWVHLEVRASVRRLQKGCSTLVCIPGHSLHQVSVISDSYSVLKAEKRSNKWEEWNKVCFLNGIFHCSTELNPPLNKRAYLITEPFSCWLLC